MKLPAHIWCCLPCYQSDQLGYKYSPVHGDWAQQTETTGQLQVEATGKIKTPKHQNEIIEFAVSTEPDEATRNESPNVDLHCLYLKSFNIQ